MAGRPRKAQRHRSSTRGLSDKQLEPRFLAIGQIAKPHGVRGEVSVAVLTDFSERFENMQTVLIGDETEVKPYQVEALRWHRGRVLIKFVGISDRVSADTLRRLYLQIPIDEAMPLEPDAYYDHQLKGLSVISDEGEQLGILAEVLDTGANDVYVVRHGKKEILLPATNEVVKSVDLNQKQMIVHLLEGLI